MNEEHRQKISEALKKYHAERGHLKKYQKSGPDHPNWKGGIKKDYYTEVAFKSHPNLCNRCGSVEKLIVHHRDRNRRNNEPENLEILCNTCHMKEHHGVRVDWECPVCGKVISIVPSDAKKRKFCSNSCRMSMRRKNGKF